MESLFKTEGFRELLR